jgi:hypothetical protein
VQKRSVAQTAVGLLLIGLAQFGQPVRAQHDIFRPERCPITQLVLQDCPNLVEARFNDGRHRWNFRVCGLIALYEKLESYSRQPETVMIRDYDSLALAAKVEAQMADSTFRMKPRFIEANTAWYLYDASGERDRSQDPHIYAFKTKAAAQKAQKALGGKLLNWAETKAKAKQVAKDWDRYAGREVETFGRPRGRSSD